jgi:hypothetical protein
LIDPVCRHHGWLGDTGDISSQLLSTINGSRGHYGYVVEISDRIDLGHRWRNSTFALHARVDRSIGECLQQGAEGYVRLLEASASAVVPLERALIESNVTSLIPDWHRRARSMALRSDETRARCAAKPSLRLKAFEGLRPPRLPRP